MRNNVVGPGSPKNSVKAYENAKLRKRPRKPKESKWAKDSLEKTNGTQEPASDVMKEPRAILGHWEKNKWQAQKGPVGLRQTNSQSE